MTEQKLKLSINRKPKGLFNAVPSAQDATKTAEATHPKTDSAKTPVEAPAKPKKLKAEKKADKATRKLIKAARRAIERIEMLKRHWPDAITPEAPRPLKLRIRQDMIDDAKARGLDITPGKIEGALATYTRRRNYLMAVAAGGYRYDMHGHQHELISLEHQTNAKVLLEQGKNLTAEAQIKPARAEG